MSPHAFSSHSPHESLYQILEISPEATSEAVGTAFRKKALEYHPDRNAADPYMLERFQRCAEAYMVLSDDSRRSTYDLEGIENLEGFRFQDFLDLCLHDLVVDQGVMKDLMRAVAPLPSNDDFMEQFINANVSVKTNAEGNTLFVCTLCAAEAPSSRFMLSHMESKHQQDALVWAEQQVARMKDSFTSFMKCCIGTDDESRTFHLADGAEVELSDSAGKQKLENEFGLALFGIPSQHRPVTPSNNDRGAAISFSGINAEFATQLQFLQTHEPDLVQIMMGGDSEEKHDSAVASSEEINSFAMPLRNSYHHGGEEGRHHRHRHSSGHHGHLHHRSSHSSTSDLNFSPKTRTSVHARHRKSSPDLGGRSSHMDGLEAHEITIHKDRHPHRGQPANMHQVYDRLYHNLHKQVHQHFNVKRHLQALHNAARV
eukprot:gnl/MRDRNA2_/MRDRNA2_67965_c0_seq1.p1 gnl/MRDRNA2_/MRDRNA2_67965_c0~~gnl/MRDRNA2_/MRDRNA2_67965_c0_seq1.p1  ORF type:complete len:428 (-),score=61.50 gnl/MRDRNA2_/MRDRNA2_67965_c0_seq1:8-1291(-)